MSCVILFLYLLCSYSQVYCINKTGCGGFALFVLEKIRALKHLRLSKTNGARCDVIYHLIPTIWSSLFIQTLHAALVPAGIALTWSWHKRCTSTDVLCELLRDSRCRRAADTPRRDRRGWRSGPASSGSGRTVAPPGPGADGFPFVWSPVAHSSASWKRNRG